MNRTDDKRKFSPEEHLGMVKASWNAYQPARMEFMLQARPDFYQFYANGGINLSDYEIELLGDVRGLKLLDIGCACDAVQAFSWANLGADVTACDICPAAIEIARENARKIDLPVKFILADSQTLTPIPDGEFDIVYATYLCWLEDIFKACRAWYRVLKPGGRLLLVQYHPVVACLEERDGSLFVVRNYHDRTPEYSDSFGGTPIADKFGGWNVDLPIVEFFHTIADIVNAIAEAGFRIERMLETEEPDQTIMAKLPEMIAIVGRKA
ncbi:MAG: class I SAM-dependent methyltransferase [Candidatus Poribacteria bacterium]